MADPRPVYPLEETEVEVQQARLLYQRLQGPLSLFPATFSRLKPLFDEEPARATPSGHRLPPAPLSQAALLQLVGGRLKPGPREPPVPSAVLEAFRSAILSEVQRVWKDMQHSLNDPVFTLHTNRQLYHHQVAYMGLAAEHLFRHYLRLMHRSHHRDVFTDSANLARLSTQLSLACAGLFDVAAVRHSLVTEMKTLRFREPGRGAQEQPPEGRHTLTIGHFIKLMRPRVLTRKERLLMEVKELQELPLLDLSKVKDFILPSPRPFREQLSYMAITTPCPPAVPPLSKSAAAKEVPKKGRAHGAVTRVRRTQSLPNMRVGQLLADELGFRLSLRPLSPDLPTHYAETAETEEEADMKRMAALSEDLRRLVQGPVLKTSQWLLDEESELPPLIKVLTLRKTNEIRFQQLKRMLHSLQQEEAHLQKQRQTLLVAPATHPQAATVNFVVHNKMVAKAADLQVSERYYVEAVAMEKCPAVYNHLLGDIDAATVKALDAELFVGQEVRDIYKEVMNTIPKDHLQLHLGAFSETPATNLERSLFFASSSLTRKKEEMIINEELSKILPAGPYAYDDVSDTVKTPNLPYKNKGSKEAYVSWLKWWKATFNTDNFLKFISNKESDHLQVIFHLYSCEEEEEKPPEIDEAEIRRMVELKKETIRLAVDRQGTVDRYSSGVWRCDDDTASLGVPGKLPASSAAATAQGAAAEELEAFPFDHRPAELRVLQRRLERLWTVLHFSQQERMDMAIKYSTFNYYPLLPEMLHSWEMAAQAIQERELLLVELEKFELVASDPNRFFRKSRKSFRMRLNESRVRAQLYFVLGQFNTELRTLLSHIKEMFNDVVTFKGRPYLKKMERDVVEMLYWLQQGRRACVLETEAHSGAHRLPPLLSRHYCTEQSLNSESELEADKVYEEMSHSIVNLHANSFLTGPLDEETDTHSSSLDF